MRQIVSDQDMGQTRHAINKKVPWLDQMRKFRVRD